MNNEETLPETGTAKLRGQESSSCVVKIQKSWGVFMRKLFRVNDEKEEKSVRSVRSTGGEVPRSSKITATVSSKKTRTKTTVSTGGEVPRSSKITATVSSKRTRTNATISSKRTRTKTWFRAKTFSSSASLIDGTLDPYLAGSEVRNQNHDREVTFLDLPLQVRRNIYTLINPQDILCLRLTAKALKNDVDTNHGVIVRCHDGRLDYEKPLQKLGIVKLIIEQFLQEDNSIYKTFFPSPHLLKTIVIAGPINQTNLRSLLKRSENLRHLSVSFQSPLQQVHIFKMKQLSLENLKILEISSDSFRSSAESFLITRSMRNLFTNVQCPNTSCLEFDIVGVSHENIVEYHELAMSFILKYKKSLKKINLKLMQMMSPAMTGNDNPPRLAEWIGDKSPMKLEEIRLNMNTAMDQWYPMIYSQSCLQTLKLDARGHHWNRLETVLNKCRKTLRNLSVTGLLPSNINNRTITPDPVDIGLLENMEVLETLEIQHEEIESRGMIPVSLIRTTLFPPTLKSVKLSHLRLKPYQAMFLFLKLPRAELLVLDFWVDSEATFSGFLAVITFLIKFEQTPVRRVEMTDYRRRMENQQESITRLRNVLQSHANIMQSHSELYSTLTIEKYYNDHNNLVL